MKKLPPIPCTRDCPKRSATCHSECIEYIEYAEAKEEERNERWKQKQIDNYAIESVIEANIKRATRKWGFKDGA